MSSGIDTLKELHRQLGVLLDQPEPGLFTWREMLSETCIRIADFSGYGKVSAFVKANKEQIAALSQEDK